MSNQTMYDEKIVNKSIGLVSFLNVALAILALAREVLIASLFGTTAVADAFLLGYFLSDVIGNMILGMAIGLACIPVFSRQQVSYDMSGMESVASTLVITIFVCTFITSSICFLLANNLIFIVGRGFTKEICDLAARLFRIMLPLIMIFPVYAVLSALLQVNQRFFVSSFGPVLFSLIITVALSILNICSLSGKNNAFFLSLSVLIGAIAMTVIQFMSLRMMGFRWRPFFSLEHLSEFFYFFLPLVLIVISNQVVLLVERILASIAGSGVIAGLNYAYKLSQFPVLTLASAAGIVTFPLMSRFFNENNIAGLKKALSDGVKLIVFINLPMSLTFFMLRQPIVEFLFKHGAFGDSSVEVTVCIFTGYSLSILAQSINYLLLRSFYALGKMGTPLFITASASCLNIVADIVLVKHLGVAGLGYGAALGATLYTLLLVVWLWRQIGFQPLQLLPPLGRITTACIPLIFVLQFFPLLLRSELTLNGSGDFICFLLTVIAGVIVYLLSCKILKVEEVKLLFSLAIGLKKIRWHHGNN